MATHKRKTLQIKRPESTSFKPADKKPLPQVSINEKAATSHLDTDQVGLVGPKTARLRQPSATEYPDNPKGQTTRIALPDEDKLRKARRADDSVLNDDALPKAEQVENAQNSSTMPIMIDTEEVQSSPTQLSLGDTGDAADQTMQIDAEALQTGNMADLLAEAADADEGNDRTMRIDPAALQTGDMGKVLAEAAASKPDADATMKIDADALQTGVLDKVMPEEIMAMETMKMEPIPLPADKKKPEAFNTSTLATPTVKSVPEEIKTEQAFNAMTMAMDAEQLAAEMAKSKTSKQSGDANLDQTMDLTSERPKTILIKRPSREAAAAPSQPTVKRVRPDAVTVRTTRPVTAVPAQAKEGTSRVDVPSMPSSTEGKTIKLRRPGGAPTSRPGAPLSRVTAGAGLQVNADGSVTATHRPVPAFAGGSLALAILTFLVAASAIWVIYSVQQPGLPMVGRLVTPDNQLMAPQ